MLRHLLKQKMKNRPICSQVILKGSFSKAPYGNPFWTFINVQNEKPKVEFTFCLLPEKIQ
jgi:hypothetical protein